MQEPATILGGLGQIVDFILKYAVMLAALGALTVGLLEAYKKVFATLARFHRKALCRWLANEAPAATSGHQIGATLAAGHYGLVQRQVKEGYDPRKAYAQLLHLTTGVPLQEGGVELDDKGGPLTRNVSRALFELEIARLMAQVQEAADAALNNPTRYGDWFAFVTRGCNPADITDWKKVLEGGADPATRDKGAAAYARIRLLMRRQLDSFQTVTAFRWREWNQWWAWIVGALLMLIAQLIQSPVALVQIDGGRWLTMLVASLFGGILAPVAKDLVDALGKAKGAA
jgi:hypothetical protein